MDKKNTDIGNVVNEQNENEKIPAIISVTSQLSFPNSTGYWFRFNDGLYHSIHCPGTFLPLSDFEESLKNGSATISGYKPFPDDLLLLIFDEDKYKKEQDIIKGTYKQEKI